MNPPDDIDSQWPATVSTELARQQRPLPLAPTTVQRIHDRLFARIHRDHSAGLLTVRAHEGEWRELGPLVRKKSLFSDGRHESYLVRMLPGARLPAHDHADNEECLLLEGDICVDGEELHGGDYQLAPKGVAHGVISTRGGCLIFIRALCHPA